MRVLRDLWIIPFGETKDYETVPWFSRPLFYIFFQSLPRRERLGTVGRALLRASSSASDELIGGLPLDVFILERLRAVPVRLICVDIWRIWARYWKGLCRSRGVTPSPPQRDSISAEPPPHARATPSLQPSPPPPPPPPPAARLHLCRPPLPRVFDPISAAAPALPPSPPPGAHLFKEHT
uniref:Uncharacterized protein n=1 Tax=Ananas comosus var. bracteatus TaxID=296719 RepID=A0A6V7NPM4_ANACO|nr:unnamed protein product [Ananas comosus var. bracteatus]